MRLNLTKSNEIAVLAAIAGIIFAPAVFAQAKPASVTDNQIQTDVNKALDKKQFRDVQATVSDGVVRLTGTVPTFADKEEADARVHHRKNVTAVDDEIHVAAVEVDDATLVHKLATKLEYDRVGYGSTPFNAITIGVRNGVVTLGGTAYAPPDKQSAVALVSSYPGVKDVIDNINVDPLSPNDDRIRIAEFRAIYGFPSLNRYAADPAKPIRIIVVNGRVTLTGMVDTQADKETANIRASAVPGVFKVTNDLQVANPLVGQK
jgi:osmotically-inducible protein OsmY